MAMMARLNSKPKVAIKPATPPIETEPEEKAESIKEETEGLKEVAQQVETEELHGDTQAERPDDTQAGKPEDTPAERPDDQVEESRGPIN